MAGDSKKVQPIIIKRIKKGGHAVHGGAWKIAYADFVTAMMAFFLLMWLLGSTTEGDKKGIADYFASPLKLSLLASGSGAGDASHVVRGGGQDLTRTTGQVKRGDIEAKRDTVNLHQLKAEQIRAEVARLENLRKKVEAAVAANPLLKSVAAHKSIFFRSPPAKYEMATPGTLRLLPTPERRKELESDYAKMRQMIFGEVPPLDHVFDVLSELERKINEKR